MPMPVDGDLIFKHLSVRSVEVTEQGVAIAIQIGEPRGILRVHVDSLPDWIRPGGTCMMVVTRDWTERK